MNETSIYPIEKVTPDTKRVVDAKTIDAADSNHKLNFATHRMYVPT